MTMEYNPEKDLTKLVIRCPFSKCHARIIKPTDQTIHEFHFNKQEFLKPSTTISTEHDGQFIKVNDAWDFDNIGVSREFESDETVRIERLIICADCERGPLGFAMFDGDEQDKNVKNLRYFIHLNSCVYVDN